MRQLSICVVVTMLLVGGLLGRAEGQATPPAPPAPAAAAPEPVKPADLPAVSEQAVKDVAEWLNIVRIAEQAANAQCQLLQSTEVYRRLRQEYTTKVEKRLPGLTVNWTRYELVPPADLPAVSEQAVKDVAEWLNIVRIAEQAANAQCQLLQSTEVYRRLRQEYTTKVEKRLPRLTVNWTRYELVPKTPPR